MSVVVARGTPNSLCSRELREGAGVQKWNIGVGLHFAADVAGSRELPEWPWLDSSNRGWWQTILNGSAIYLLRKAPAWIMKLLIHRFTHPLIQ